MANVEVCGLCSLCWILLEYSVLKFKLLPLWMAMQRALMHLKFEKPTHPGSMNDAVIYCCDALNVKASTNHYKASPL